MTKSNVNVAASVQADKLRKQYEEDEWRDSL